MHFKRSPFAEAPLPPRRLDASFHAKNFDPKQRSEWVQSRNRRFAATMRNGDLYCEAIGNAVDACRPTKRCGLIVCHSCFRRDRRIILGQAKTSLEGVGDTLWGVSVASWKWARLEDLDFKTIAKFAEEAHQALDASPLANTVMFLAWDFSVNIYPCYGDLIRVQPHLYGIVAEEDRDLVRNVFKSITGPKNKWAPSPVRTRTVDSIWDALNYVLKTQFKRRKRYRNPKKDNRLDTCKDRLRAHEVRMLAVLQQKLGITRRLFLRNIKRVGHRFRPTRGNSNTRT